jgi:hypothetical protein
MLNAREWIEEHLDDLGQNERQSLAEGDARLMRLAHATEAKTLDADYLRETARVVTRSKLAAMDRAA